MTPNKTTKQRRQNERSDNKKRQFPPHTTPPAQHDDGVTTPHKQRGKHLCVRVCAALMGLCCSSLESPRDSTPVSCAPYTVASSSLPAAASETTASDEDGSSADLHYKAKAPPKLVNIASNYKVCVPPKV